MIAEDVQRKIWLGALIGAVILGLLFLIWAVFLNRGTMLIHARSPYSITIEGMRTENCPTDECTVIVAPGDYNITVNKIGYKSVSKQITVPLGSPYSDTIALQFIPVVAESSRTPDQVFPAAPQLNKAQLDRLGIGADTKLFFDSSGKNVCYIVRDPNNFRQTLYMAAVGNDGTVGAAQLVTSFLRDIPYYLVSPSPDGNKVAVIDQSPGGATLYMVDRQAKNRASILTYPMIRDMRWIPGGSDFLFQARDQAGGPESIFLYRGDDGKTTKLDLNTPLDDIAIVDSNRIFAVTNQKLPEASKFDALQGQLILLGENQSTVEVNAVAATGATVPAVTPAYAFVDFSLIANQARLITVLTKDPFPTKIKAGADGKSIDYLQGDKIFQLRFDE